MYVRWKRKRRRDAWHYEGREKIIEPQWLRSAVLVESRRIDGKPTQRTIKYLGAIREDRIASALWRARFWRSVDTNLTALALTSEERAPIEAAIHNVIPFPTMEAVNQEQQESDERLAAASRAIRKHL